LHLIFNFNSFVGEPTLNAHPQHQQRQNFISFVGEPTLNAHPQHQQRQILSRLLVNLPSMLTHNTNKGKTPTKAKEPALNAHPQHQQRQENTNAGISPPH
jgi:hypothetical protein